MSKRDDPPFSFAKAEFEPHINLYIFPIQTDIFNNYLCLIEEKSHITDNVSFAVEIILIIYIRQRCMDLIWCLNLSILKWTCSFAIQLPFNVLRAHEEILVSATDKYFE